MDQQTELARIHAVDPHTNPVDGEVYWSPVKSGWMLAHYLVALIGGALTISADAFAVFLVTTAITLCLGHSLGMHRKLIHNSYASPKWLEYLFIHLGVLVGMAGPIGMVRTHDLRDWAQRQPDCHPYLRHGERFWRDAWWQLHCDLRLKHPPAFVPESQMANDRVLQFMERTWMLQQLPLAIVLYALGGAAWVVWGISARVAVSVTGHWLIGYFAHNEGDMDHEVAGAAVQGRNVKWASYATMGESWHNNHHAFPGSAIFGIYADQPDPGWWVLSGLQKWGLVWNVVLPSDLPARESLLALSERARAMPGIGGQQEMREAGETMSCTVYYNSACPVCKAGIEYQRQQLADPTVAWVDIHAKPELAAKLDIPLEDLRERLHVIDANQHMHVGIDALTRLSAPSAGQRLLRKLLQLPGLHALAARAYNGFANVLYRWNRHQGHW